MKTLDQINEMESILLAAVANNHLFSANQYTSVAAIVIFVDWLTGRKPETFEEMIKIIKQIVPIEDVEEFQLNEEFRYKGRIGQG